MKVLKRYHVLRWRCRIYSVETATRSEHTGGQLGVFPWVARRPAVGFINHHDPNKVSPNASVSSFFSRMIFAPLLVGVFGSHARLFVGEVHVTHHVSRACFGFILFVSLCRFIVICVLSLPWCM